ncbi:MAG TPA: hypothetical protein EYQ24_02955 [Bacteroidetes bacterium]|nr:hypothetical protein [Bacteroidota bacterium]
MTSFLLRGLPLAGGAVLAALFVLVQPPTARSYHTGAPPAFDGFQDNCTACHIGADANSGDGGIEIVAPETYVPGEPVEITVRVTNTTTPDPNGVGSRTGFEVGVRDGAGTPVGSFDLGGATTMRLANNGSADWVTHTADGLGQSEWTFSWVPPASGAPPAVTIYAAGNAANGNQIPSGDLIYTATDDLTLATAAETTPEDDGLRLGPLAPSPVRARAGLTLTLPEPATVVARLVDARGRTVRQLPASARPAGDSRVEVDAFGLAPGLYFLVVEAPMGRRTASVVVSR